MGSSSSRFHSNMESDEVSGREEIAEEDDAEVVIKGEQLDEFRARIARTVLLALGTEALCNVGKPDRWYAAALPVEEALHHCGLQNLLERKAGAV